MKTREIKFKAWDEYEKEMYDWYDICKFDRKQQLSIHDLLNNFIQNLKPMQYTGLKDKQGKEIYEGDIVNCNDTNSIVEWNVYQWVFKSIPYKQQVATLKSHSIVEVIGNIYQNDHLLKQ